VRLAEKEKRETRGEYILEKWYFLQEEENIVGLRDIVEPSTRPILPSTITLGILLHSSK